jgi:hypothetical protein
VPDGDALERPAVCGEDDLLGGELRLAAWLAWHLDDDLVHGGLDGVGELVPLFGHDRERRQEVAKRQRELVDLGRCRVPPGEDTEVDANLDAGLLLRADEQRNRGFVGEWTHAGPLSGRSNS